MTRAGSARLERPAAEVPGRRPPAGLTATDEPRSAPRAKSTSPTNEYEKVAAMEVEPTEDRIAIKLQAKPGTSLDAAEIAACLDYTVGKSEA